MDANTDIKNNNIENIIPMNKTLNIVQDRKRIVYTANTERNCDTHDNITEGQTVVMRRKIDRKRADVNKQLWRRSTIERSGLPPPPVPPESPPPTSPVSPTSKTRSPISPQNSCISTKNSNLSPVSPTNNNKSPPISTEKISRKRQSSIKRQSLPPPPLPPSSP